MKKLLVLVLIFGLAACATTQYIPAQKTSQNSAKIYIKRPSAFFGSAITAPVYVNNKYIGRLGTGGQLEWTVSPGPVTVQTSSGDATMKLESSGSNRLTFTAQKGKTYTVYLEIPYQLGFGVPFASEGAFNVRLAS